MDTFPEVTEFFCQTTHCYVTCNLKRELYTTAEMAQTFTNTAEDALFYPGARLQVKGTYFAYTDVPN